MANSHKTKAEILQELESIKGLLLEQDDIPVLQEIEETLSSEGLVQQLPIIPKLPLAVAQKISTEFAQATLAASHESAPGTPTLAKYNETRRWTDGDTNQSRSPEKQMEDFCATKSQPFDPRPFAKADGENPFLPRHIRERLHGNNPPPLFEYETAKKIVGATKNLQNSIYRPRQQLIDDVLRSLLPHLESELRHHLFAMSVEDLEDLLHSDH